MKKLILIICLATLLFSCSKEDTKETKEWTLIYFMAADNNLTGAAIRDINKLENVVTPTNTNIIVMLDGNKESKINAVYHIQKLQPDFSDELTSRIVRSYETEPNCGDPNTLSNFVNWTIDNYPAKKYMLVISSHGDGWTRNRETKSICADHHISGGGRDRLDVVNGELRSAFDQFKDKIDLLIFDACNMQNMEVIGEIHDKVDYIVGSEEEVYTEGFPWGKIMKFWNSHSSIEDLIEAIGIAYINYQMNISPNSKITFSGVKSSEYSKLADRFSNIYLNRSTFTREQFNKANRNSYHFNDNSQVSIKEYFLNLKAVSENRMAKAECDTMLAKIQNFFVASMSYGYENRKVGTATIWYPEFKEELTNSKNSYSTLKFSRTDWLKILIHIFE